MSDDASMAGLSSQPDIVMTSASQPSQPSQPSGADQDGMLAVRQIEFYFADSNLPYDRFMWGLHTKNAEHLVPLQTVASFKRMREHSITSDLPALASLIQSHSSLLEVKETPEGWQVRRSTPLLESNAKSADERSIYVKGFPTDEKDDDALQKKLERHFQQYASTNQVRTRRDGKNFKGSVFTEFTSPDGVNAYLNADPKPTWEGKELLMMTKEAYCEMKIQEKGLTGKAAAIKRGYIGSRKFDAFKLGLVAESKPPPPEDMKTEDSGSTGSKEVFLEILGSKLKIHQDESGTGYVKEEDVPFVKGATMVMLIQGTGDRVDFEAIKNPVRDLFEGKAPFLSHSPKEGGDASVQRYLAGFHKALTSEDQEKIRSAVTKVDERSVVWEVEVPEEEEKQFQISRAQVAARSALRKSQEGGSRGGRGRGGGRGGRGGGRGGDRGGRGGRGRGRGRGRGGGGGRGDDGGRGRDSNGAGGDSSEGVAGEKRKRGIEPDGGLHTGIRGVDAPPQLAAKKSKTSEDA